MTAIYWRIERGFMVVHSQPLRASASEVHAMIEGSVIFYGKGGDIATNRREELERYGWMWPSGCRSAVLLNLCGHYI
ncbi:hypothetical protein [Streptosporangium sp. NPDC003464]